MSAAPPTRPVQEVHSPAAELARACLDEHQRLCDDHGPARWCDDRASCRQAAEVLDMANGRAEWREDDWDEYG